MKIHHHFVKKYRDAKEAPLWKWIVFIMVAVAMPLFFALVNMMQTKQAANYDNQLTAESQTKS